MSGSVFLSWVFEYQYARNALVATSIKPKSGWLKSAETIPLMRDPVEMSWSVFGCPSKNMLLLLLKSIDLT